MEDFVIMNIKNFSHAQNCQNCKNIENFYVSLVCLFFCLHMYNSKLVTNRLIIVGVHLMKKERKKDIRLLGAMIDLIRSVCFDGKPCVKIVFRIF